MQTFKTSNEGKFIKLIVHGLCNIPVSNDDHLKKNIRNHAGLWLRIPHKNGIFSGFISKFSLS